MDQIIAALILAGGAFYGVWKGAVYAVDRLSAQLAEERRLSEERLDAEETRLQMQLDAEATRLQMQLDADQTKSDRAELRDVLDEGAVLLADSLEELSAIKTHLGFFFDAGGKPNASEGKTAIPFVASLEPRYPKLAAYYQRLLLRFKANDKIPSSVQSAMDAHLKATTCVSVPRGELDEQKRKVFLAAKEEFSDALATFLVDCRSRFGVAGASD